MYAYSAVSSSGLGKNKFRRSSKLSKLKHSIIDYRSIESSPQAKVFTAVVTLYTQIMNRIVNEIEIQEREKLAAGEMFYSPCHSRKHTINEIIRNFLKAFVTV